MHNRTVPCPGQSTAPTQSGANLFIAHHPADSERYLLAVFGTIPLGRLRSHGVINNINTAERPGGMVYNIFGDDGYPTYRGGDRFTRAPATDLGYLYATDEGIHYRREISVPNSDLDEDDGTDEIYDQARFIDGGRVARGDQHSTLSPATARR